MQILQFISAGLIIAGLAVTMLVVVGIIRADNSYTILHIAAVNDAIGSAITLFGVVLLMVSYGKTFEAIKTCSLVVAICLMNPISSYVLTKILYFYGKVPMDEKMKIGKQ